MLATLRLFIVTLLVLTVAACAPDNALPTAVELPTNIPDITPTQEIGAEAAPAESPTPRPTRVRPTLPPPFTATPTPTETPTPTPDGPAATPVAPAAAEPLPVCDSFAVDFSESSLQFPIETQPRAAWTPVEGATSYWVRLSDDTGRLLRDDIFIAETFYDFDEDLFELGRVYAWTVAPRDAAGIQMCFAVGSEFQPFQPLQ